MSKFIGTCRPLLVSIIPTGTGFSISGIPRANIMSSVVANITDFPIPTGNPIVMLSSLPFSWAPVFAITATLANKTPFDLDLLFDKDEDGALILFLLPLLFLLYSLFAI